MWYSELMLFITDQFGNSKIHSRIWCTMRKLHFPYVIPNDFVEHARQSSAILVSFRQRALRQHAATGLTARERNSFVSLPLVVEGVTCVVFLFYLSWNTVVPIITMSHMLGIIDNWILGWVVLRNKCVMWVSAVMNWQDKKFEPQCWSAEWRCAL